MAVTQRVTPLIMGPVQFFFGVNMSYRNVNIKKYLNVSPCCDLINKYININAFFLALGLFLSICTNLRSSLYPFGPGEFILLIFSGLGIYRAEKFSLYKNVFFIFWVFVFVGMFLGALFSGDLSVLYQRTFLAYLFTAIITVGLSAYLSRVVDSFIVSLLKNLIYISLFMLMVALLLFNSSDIYLIQLFKLVHNSGVRFTAWSSNANQLALFFIPLPIWAFSLLVNNRSKGVFGKYMLILAGLALLFIGMLVRSDGLIISWLLQLLVVFCIGFSRGLIIYNFKKIITALFLIFAAFVAAKLTVDGGVRGLLICKVHSLSNVNENLQIDCSRYIEGNQFEIYRIGFRNAEDKRKIREELWTHGIESWAESPIFGLGPGYHSWYNLIPEGVQSEKLEAHNIIIDLLSQGGVISALAWCVLIFHLIRRSWGGANAPTLALIIGIVAFTLLHNSRQPYLWIMLILSHEIIVRRIFVFGATKK